jgi:hypothetical protein
VARLMVLAAPSAQMSQRVGLLGLIKSGLESNIHSHAVRFGPNGVHAQHLVTVELNSGNDTQNREILNEKPNNAIQRNATVNLNLKMKMNIVRLGETRATAPPSL